MRFIPYYLLSAAAVLVQGCTSDNGTTFQPKAETNESAPRKTAFQYSGNHLKIEDTTRYNASFLQELKSTDYGMDLVLQGNYLLADNEKVTFPDELKLNKTYTFSTHDMNTLFEVELKRINLTDFKYTVLVSGHEAVIFRSSGIATLNTGFFLGAESIEDPETSEMMLACEYRDTKTKFPVRMLLGLEKDRYRHQWIVFTCDGSPMEDIMLTLQ